VTGEALFPARTNPLDWDWIPVKYDKPRAMLTPEYFEILLAARGDRPCYLDQADPTGVTRRIVVLARYGAHRIGSIVQLRGTDWITDLDGIRKVLRESREPLLIPQYAEAFHRAGGVLWYRWQADKENLDRPLPQHPEVVAILNEAVAGLPAPDAPLFRSATDPMRPISRQSFHERLCRAEDLARADGYEMPVHARDEKEDPDEQVGIHGARSLRSTEWEAMGHQDVTIRLIGGWVTAHKADVRKRKYVRGDEERIVTAARGERVRGADAERLLGENAALREQLTRLEALLAGGAALKVA
jgi:hypothetical protein